MDRTFPALLPRLVEAATPPAGAAGGRLEIWTFDDEATRRAAERTLAARGIPARVRSSYKPLVHAFLEEIDLDGVRAVDLRYPLAAAGHPERFRLEAYPLAALVREGAGTFAGTRSLTMTRRPDTGLFYEVGLEFGDGRIEQLRVEAPNRLHLDPFGEPCLSPTGWIRRPGEAGIAVETECEAAFAAALAVISAQDWGVGEPLFEQLVLSLRLAPVDRPLTVGDEVVSLAEAFHEDFYFSLLELFQIRSGRARGDRGLRPGQIVPMVVQDGAADGLHLRIETRPLDREDPLEAEQDLDTATTALSPHQIAAEAGRLAGARLDAVTRAGRTVACVHVAGEDAAVMISGGQHANETTGIVGALRAGRRLASRPGAHFVLAPLENPDGYALHRRLVRDNPRHMHHAARYTAFGDDLEYRDRAAGAVDLGETEIRRRAVAASGARLHVTLHGYPAHEWTRPFTGYVPKGYELWTLPKGFFLILRHHAGWAGAAERLLDQVTRRLAGLDEVRALTERQLALYAQHAGEPDLRVVNGFPCQVSEDPRSLMPVVLITEYPDETIHGAPFVLGHSAQAETAVAAYEAWQEIARDGALPPIA